MVISDQLSVISDQLSVISAGSVSGGQTGPVGGVTALSQCTVPGSPSDSGSPERAVCRPRPELPAARHPAVSSRRPRHDEQRDPRASPQLPLDQRDKQNSFRSLSRIFFKSRLKAPRFNR